MPEGKGRGEGSEQGMRGERGRWEQTEHGRGGEKGRRRGGGKEEDKTGGESKRGMEGLRRGEGREMRESEPVGEARA